ncbi:MAG: TusE/DsrC/DsvC family sulfur relay protein [Gammaproteobacteria bacterium]|nr:TusE/DsrC/DsvC family sulfur relay protein [Gammaproteobacteria bacterium]
MNSTDEGATNNGLNKHLVGAFDEEGFLKDLSLWSLEIATLIATTEKINLLEPHWEIIYLTRQFYDDYDLSPSMRVLVKHVANTLGKDKGRSIYLLKLFPGSPAKLICKIAGLPKPTNCI